MTQSNSFSLIHPGDDCRDYFKNAYNNRYTWSDKFPGYKGDIECIFDGNIHYANFEVSPDLKSKVTNIKDDNIIKAICSQLWEVTIHRVRRSFETTHGENTFTCTDVNNDEITISVGGKNNGDSYKVKNNIVTMVKRHIHGSLITINTKSVIQTGEGYLSNSYNSAYNEPKTGKVLKGISHFEDMFKPLYDRGPWVLTQRTINTKDPNSNLDSVSSYKFLNLSKF